MERDRKARIVAVTSMLFVVIFLTIAYAVFSNNLNIQNMSATVKANEGNFSIKFSKSSTKIDESDINPQVTDGAEASNTLPAHIDNSGPNPKITNLGATFETLTNSERNSGYIYYNFYVINDGEYDAYFKGIKIANVIGYDKPIVCIPNEGTSKKLVDEACRNMHVEISVSNNTLEVTPAPPTSAYSTSTSSLPSSAPSKGEEIKLAKPEGGKYSYHFAHISIGAKGNAGAAASAIDGSYDIKIGNVTVEYSTQNS